MNITWTYWKLYESPSLKSITGVCNAESHELQCEMNDYADENTAKLDMENTVTWALENEQEIKRHILEHYYLDMIYICCLYSENVQKKVESADELRALVADGQDVGIAPFASRENMERYLKLNQVTRDYGYDGFSLDFVPSEEGLELSDSLGGHGPLVSVNGDFSMGEVEWSG